MLIGSTISIPGQASLLGFNGNFATLFPGAYQVLQTDLGLTYGGTMLATAGNTSTTVVTLSGSLSTTPVPIWVRCTLTGSVNGTGASFSVYYDGLGVTPAMTGIFPSAGVPVALTGAGAGLSLTWGAGNGAINDTWKATCAALADQSGNGNHALQATASAQPLIAAGLNGKVELIGDGVDDFLNSATYQPPAGAMLWMVYRQITSGAFKYLTDSPGGNRRAIYANGATTAAFNGAELVGGTLPLGSYGRLWCIHNDASSTIKVGSNAPVGGNEGANAQAPGRTIFCVGNLGTFTNMGLFALVWAPPGSTAAPDAAVNTAPGYGVGSIAV